MQGPYVSMPKIAVKMSAMKLDATCKTKQIKLLKNLKLLSDKELCISVLLIWFYVVQGYI